MMKVFYAKSNIDYGGGMCLVAANSAEEAFLVMLSEDSLVEKYVVSDISHVENGITISERKCDDYPPEAWTELKGVYCDTDVPRFIDEDSYCE